MQAKLNVVQSIQRFLNKYGFRCINELKLEEHTLHDDPGFVLNTIAGEYVHVCVHCTYIVHVYVIQCTCTVYIRPV